MQMISYKDHVVYGDDTYRIILSATENCDDVLQFIPKNASRTESYFTQTGVSYPGLFTNEPRNDFQR